MKHTYVKLRFTSRNGATAGLVMETARYLATSITELSRLFPYSETQFMARLEVSAEYPTWEAAFNHTF